MGHGVRIPSCWMAFLFFLCITMFGYRTRGINRMVQDFANFVVCFVLCKELLPMLDALHVY